MKKIIKTEPPQDFLKYLETPGVSFEGMFNKPKSALRQRLLEDQGFICCYCGQRIYNDNHTKIEHIKCQENNDALTLEFSNMLACCDGGESDRRNKVKHGLHCDAKKDDADLPISPLDDVDDLLLFFDDGTVKGKGTVGKELIRVLGLDVQFLNTERKNAIDSYQEKPVEDWKEEYYELSQKNTDGQFVEFCFVLQSYIKLFHGEELSLI